MIFVVDNYDSFTYNLVQYFGELGADIVVRRNDEVDLETIEAMSPAHIVISPGPGTPDQSGISRQVIRHYAGRIPILGVCLGHQCISDVFGARIMRAPRLMHGKTSAIAHDGKGVYKGLSEPFVATRYHSLIVDEHSIPAVLDVTARTDEGEIMGVRHREFLIEGVQFHPESILTPIGKTLVRNFLELAA